MAKTYVIEHLDGELGEWSSLEYKTIVQECKDIGARVILSSVSASLKLPPELDAAENLAIEQRNVEEYFPTNRALICLLDPAAQQELSIEDGHNFEVFLFGGILGDDPPRDRTSELRHKGFSSRRLGPVQMTTDTAVRVTRKVIQEQVSLTDIQYIDFPEIKINDNESIEMPFRYIKDAEGNPVMPAGMVDLIKKDSEKGIEDLL